MFRSNKNIPFLAHSYPLWIQIYLLIIASCMLLFVPCFIIYQAPTQLKMIKKLKRAEKFFYTKDYLQAIRAYGEIIEKYPKYSIGKKKIAAAAFALINNDTQDDPFFYLALDFLAGQPYEEGDFERLEKYLPDSYKQKFKDSFVIRSIK